MGVHRTLHRTVTVGTRLFCQRPELFPKDTTRPLYAKPQSEHSLTRDTQWVGGSHKRHRTATASNAAPQSPERENQPTQKGGIPAESSSHTGSNPQTRTKTQIEHPSTMSPASNTSKEAGPCPAGRVCRSVRVLSGRSRKHGHGKEAPAPAPPRACASDSAYRVVRREATYRFASWPLRRAWAAQNSLGPRQLGARHSGPQGLRHRQRPPATPSAAHTHPLLNRCNNH